MAKKKKELPSLSPTLPIDLSPVPEPALLTALGGLPLVAQTFRTLKLHESVERHVEVKQRARGFSESEVVESLMLLHGAGGDCVDDLRRLKADEGLEPMLGHAIPSPEMVRSFLERFHSDVVIEVAKAARKPHQLAFIPEETAPLEGLARVNDDLLREMGRRMPSERIGTVDQDATIQESRKKEALPHYARCVEQKADWMMARILMGKLLVQLGRRAEARPMLNEALRAVILEGATLASQGPHLAGLAAWGGVSFMLALRWFRWS
mgnify:CR=1 FL=1